MHFYFQLLLNEPTHQKPEYLIKLLIKLEKIVVNENHQLLKITSLSMSLDIEI